MISSEISETSLFVILFYVFLQLNVKRNRNDSDI